MGLETNFIRLSFIGPMCCFSITYHFYNDKVLTKIWTLPLMFLHPVDKGLDYLLCILTSKHLLGKVFAGQKIFLSIFVLFSIKMSFLVFFHAFSYKGFYFHWHSHCTPPPLWYYIIHSQKASLLPLYFSQSCRARF